MRGGYPKGDHMSFQKLGMLERKGDGQQAYQSGRMLLSILLVCKGGCLPAAK